MTLSPGRDLGPRMRASANTAEVPLGSSCEAPFCLQVGTEVHHIVPRSRTAGPKTHVNIDEFDIRNVCKLCKEHHLAVTGGIGGHKARITWDGGWVWWSRAGDGWTMEGMLA